MKSMLKIPKLLGDNCVLQRGAAIRIWGNCVPEEMVEITLLAQGGEHEEAARCVATANEKGIFIGYFEQLCAGGPYCLMFRSGEDEIVSHNVYVGDVFVCAGQSNMELPMRRVRERYPEEFEEAMDPEGPFHNPCVHVYKVQEDYDFKQDATEHKNAQWGICAPDQLAEVSAFSYFLGKELSEEKGVPIGILNLSLGGTPIQAWMSEEGLKNWPYYLEERRALESKDYCQKLTEQYMEKEIGWQREIRKRELPWKEEYIKRGISENGRDVGENRDQNAEAGAENKNRGWKTISLPGYLAEAGLENFCGTILLRKRFQVREACAGKEALLRLGTLTDADCTYVNGVFVGDTGYCYPPRRYTVPAGALKGGANEVLIYLTCRNGGGRMTKGKTIELVFQDAPPISLAGTWEYKVLSEVGPAPEQVFLNRGATGLFHGMVAPCLPYTVSGVVWYQGESNDCKPGEYQGLLPDMIADWRNRWMQEKLPFVIVQLPNCGIDIAGGDAWPQIREAQRRTGSLPDVAVTVNIDIGEDNDLHPLNKKEAAHRAVLALRRIVYHEDLVSEGPYLTGWEVVSDEERFNGIIVKFDRELAILDCATGQIFSADSNGSEGRRETHPSLRSAALPFEFAEKDGIWQPLKASVSGKEIALFPMKTGESVCVKPVHVRYAWRSAPGRYLLVAAECVAHEENASHWVGASGNGGERLPVSPFSLELMSDDELDYCICR